MRAPDFFALMKPRVMFLAVFTTFVGMISAPVSVGPLQASMAMPSAEPMSMRTP
jgi:protoheme IX farnesyltransferase